MILLTAERLLGGAVAVLMLTSLASAAPVVPLPVDPPATRTAALEEIWRIGGEEDEDILLGLVSGGVIDDDGNTYIIDRQLSQVLVMSPDGDLLDTLGREGEGPGEFRRANGMFLTPTGVGVVQGFPGKVVLINRDGTPGGEISLGDTKEGGFRFVRRLYFDGEHLVAMAGRTTFDRETGISESTTSLLVMDPDGVKSAEFASHTNRLNMQRLVFDEAAIFAETNAWTVAPGGPVYTLGARDDYRINVYDLGGGLVRVLERPFTVRKRTREDKDRMVEESAFFMNRRRQVPENKALDTDPAIRTLETTEDGRLFVTNCHAAPRLLAAGTAGRFDVIDPDGTFVEELTLAFPGFDPEVDRLAFLDGRHFLVLLNDGPARDAMRAGFRGGAEADEEAEDPEDVEPLEVVLVRLP